MKIRHKQIYSPFKPIDNRTDLTAHNLVMNMIIDRVNLSLNANPIKTLKTQQLLKRIKRK